MPKWLLLLAMLVVGCRPEEDDDMGKGGRGLPPWHMWGTKQDFELTTTGVGQLSQQRQQLVRINYKRPETWRFTFAAKIVDGQVANGFTAIIDYSLTIGTGRSSFTMQPAPRFQFFAAVGALTIGAQKFTSQIYGPVTDTAFPNRDNILQTISAQDIQCEATLLWGTGTLGDKVKIEVHAYFSPETHIRPEWMRTEPSFPGEEDASD